MSSSLGHPHGAETCGARSSVVLASTAYCIDGHPCEIRGSFCANVPPSEIAVIEDGVCTTSRRRSGDHLQWSAHFGSLTQSWTFAANYLQGEPPAECQRTLSSCPNNEIDIESRMDVLNGKTCRSPNTVSAASSGFAGPDQVALRAHVLPPIYRISSKTRGLLAMNMWNSLQGIDQIH